jgi:trans-aconitate methyltransferase
MNLKINDQGLQTIFNGPYWCVDFINLTDDYIEIKGWAVLKEVDFQHIIFSCNGEPFDQVTFPIHRKDIEKIFWFLPNAKDSGFRCQKKLSKNTNNFSLELSMVDSRRGVPFTQNQNYYFVTDSKINTPEARLRKKVHGGDCESSFALEGYSSYVKCKKALELKLGKTYEDFERLLDWGCGCGRMTRYFQSNKSLDIYGVDIDEENINWSSENLKFASFEKISLRPPTLLKPSFYDLIIGISVFTHLKEEDQFKWLEELSRISPKDGIVMMSVHGDSTACRSGIDDNTYLQWRKTGFLDLGVNNDLGESVSENDYYRNTLHTNEYIFENWAKYFEIIDIIPGYIGNHQDLVIMKSLRV